MTIISNQILWLDGILSTKYFALQDTNPEAVDHLKLEFYPFAQLADLVPKNVVRILINRDVVGSFGRRKSDIILNDDIIKVVKKLEEEIDW